MFYPLGARGGNRQCTKFVNKMCLLCVQTMYRLNKKNPALNKAKAGYLKIISRREFKTIPRELVEFCEDFGEKPDEGNFRMARLCKLATHKKKSFPAVSRKSPFPASFLMSVVYLGQ